MILPFAVLAFLVAANDELPVLLPNRLADGSSSRSASSMAIGGWKLITVLGRIPAEERVLDRHASGAGDGRPGRRRRTARRGRRGLPRPGVRAAAAAAGGACPAVHRRRTGARSARSGREPASASAPARPAWRSCSARSSSQLANGLAQLVDASRLDLGRAAAPAGRPAMTVEQYRTRQLAYTAGAIAAGAFAGLAARPVEPAS